MRPRGRGQGTRRCRPFEGFVIAFLVLFDESACVPGAAPAQPVQFEDGFRGYRQIGSAFINHFEGVAIAADFLFVAVSQKRFAEDDRVDSLPVDFNPRSCSWIITRQG